jgi:hypothetical protein
MQMSRCRQSETVWLCFCPGFVGTAGKEVELIGDGRNLSILHGTHLVWKELIEGGRSSSKAEGAHWRWKELIKGRRSSLEAEGAHQRQKELIKGRRSSSKAEGAHQRRKELIGGRGMHWRQRYALEAEVCIGGRGMHWSRWSIRGSQGRWNSSKQLEVSERVASR